MKFRCHIVLKVGTRGREVNPTQWNPQTFPTLTVTETPNHLRLSYSHISFRKIIYLTSLNCKQEKEIYKYYEQSESKVIWEFFFFHKGIIKSIETNFPLNKMNLDLLYARIRVKRTVNCLMDLPGIVGGEPWAP